MLHRFFERAFAFAKEYEGESVIKYAVARLRSIPIARSNWEFAFDAISQCMVSDPSCLGRALEFIGAYSKAKYRVPLVRLKQVLNTVIEIHAPLGHGSYVAWALWGCLLFDLKITASNIKKIRVMDDSIVALLALHAKSKGLISGKRVSFAGWKAVMNKDGLIDEMWLLSYEAKKKGWLPSIGQKNHLSTDNLFAFLDAKDVCFYDTDAVKNWWMTLRTKKVIATSEKEELYI